MNLTTEDYKAMRPTGMRLHDRPSLILPEHLDASKRARVVVDMTPVCREHRIGAVEWAAEWEGGDEMSVRSR